jgi:hypothetical protein
MNPLDPVRRSLTLVASPRSAEIVHRELPPSSPDPRGEAIADVVFDAGA